jgi:hypothetical protein
MAAQEIPRQEWARALEQFSRRHRGWLASVANAAQAPLGSVEMDGETLVICLRGAAALRIEAPTALRMDDMGLDVESMEGLTRVQFRSSASPEALDGLAPAER